MQTDQIQAQPGCTPFCFATVVVEKAIESLVASGADAQLKDEHPWLVAERDFKRAQRAQLNVPLLLATPTEKAGADTAQAEGQTCRFSHWAFIRSVSVLELSGKRFLSQIQLGSLTEVSPLFSALDSLSLKPPDEQLLREEVEGVRTQRVALSEQHVRPYAICETPGFIPRLTPWLYPKLKA